MKGENFVLDENYYTVYGWMINRLKLKGNQLIVYAAIYGFSQCDDNEYTGGLSYLSRLCGGVSKRTVINVLKELTESGLVIRREETINSFTYVSYRVNLEVVKKLHSYCEKIPPDTVEKSQSCDEKISLGGEKISPDTVEKSQLGGEKISLGGEKISPNNIYIETNKETNKDIYKESNKYIYREICDYLNLKAGTRYKATTSDTKKRIDARINEGFSIDDFKKVIDNKCDDWIGTEWEKYLRPETLFGNKFESYLNSPVKAKKGKYVMDYSADENPYENFETVHFITRGEANGK